MAWVPSVSRTSLNAQNTAESTSCALSTKIKPDSRGSCPGMTSEKSAPMVLFRRGAAGGRGAEAAFDVIDHQVLEIGRKRRAAQRGGLLAVDEYRRGRLLAGTRQRDADVGVLRFARAVDDAAHDGDVERLDAGIARLPRRHRFPDEVLDVLGELLERGRRGASAAGAGGDERHERAEAHRLQQFLRDLDLERAVAVGL